MLNDFSPKVEMASIDEAYLDVTGTRDGCLGRPMKAARDLHDAVKRDTGLNCSDRNRDIAAAGQSRFRSGEAARDALDPPGCEAAFLAPLDVRRIPGVGQEDGSETGHIRDPSRRRHGAICDEKFVESLLGKWGLALVGKAHGLDAGGYFQGEVGDRDDPKSISHEHTFGAGLG